MFLLRTLAAVALTLGLWAAVSPAPASAQSDCAGNLLRNADFEGSYSWRHRPEILVADGWNPWWDNNPGTDGFNFIPEYKTATADLDSRRVHSGAKAQQLFNTFATHTAGIFQLVNVTPGQTYRFSIQGQAWSSNRDDPAVSAEPGDYSLFVGISTRGTDKFWEVDTWSGPSRSYDGWSRLEVTAKAAGGTISVWTKGAPIHRVKHNNSYWDSACLQAVASIAPGTPTTPAPAPRADGDLATGPGDLCVAVSSANVHGSASTSSGVIKSKPSGSLIRPKTRDASSSWYGVALSGTSSLGWMRASDLAACAIPSGFGAQTRHVAVGSAEVRWCPTCGLVKTKSQGDPIRVLRGVGDWLEVELGGLSLPGFMRASDLN